MSGCGGRGDLVPDGVNVISDGMCVCEGGLNLAFTVLCSGEMPTVGGFFVCVCVARCELAVCSGVRRQF
jgi:hypothetical protein